MYLKKDGEDGNWMRPAERRTNCKVEAMDKQLN